MIDEKKQRESDVSSLLGLINSALKEQEELIKSSYTFFDSVLKQANPISDPDPEEKEGYDSILANNLKDIKNKIVFMNNLILNFNKKCDL